MPRKTVLLAPALIAGIVASVGAAQAAGRSVPTVVELFTSQGCSSCPAANANLIKLRGRSQVLPLSFAVTYWDRLGWKDTFGKPEFTRRQAIYETPLGREGPFTPQMVVNGAHDGVGSSFEEVESLLARTSPVSGPSIHLEQGLVSIGRGSAPAGGADIWLVRYDPAIVDVAIGRGENSGRTLPHTNVVHDLIRIGRWIGEPSSQSFPAAEPGLRTAILVQQSGGGPILAAATE